MEEDEVRTANNGKVNNWTNGHEKKAKKGKKRKQKRTIVNTIRCRKLFINPQLIISPWVPWITPTFPLHLLAHPSSTHFHGYAAVTLSPTLPPAHNSHADQLSHAASEPHLRARLESHKAGSHKAGHTHIPSVESTVGIQTLMDIRVASCWV